MPGGVSPRRALPRGPRTPRLFQSLRYSLWPYASLDISTRRYGDCYTAYPLGGPPMVVFTHPILIGQCVEEHQDLEAAVRQSVRFLLRAITPKA